MTNGRVLPHGENLSLDVDGFVLLGVNVGGLGVVLSFELEKRMSKEY